MSQFRHEDYKMAAEACIRDGEADVALDYFLETGLVHLSELQISETDRQLLSGMIVPPPVASLPERRLRRMEPRRLQIVGFAAAAATASAVYIAAMGAGEYFYENHGLSNTQPAYSGTTSGDAMNTNEASAKITISNENSISVSNNNTQSAFTH